ncbi:hypothetical protein DW094_09280 [Ruminococcaceae bacterium AM07-15]|nr:hypothetical protein DW094_09280 [Ruminococcaceae bacterium AM07-15]
MKKQVLSLALSATMLASMLPKPAFAADNTTFPDMPNDWSTQALQNAINNGLLNGIDGKIAAGENLTRAQMAAIVTRAFGTNGKADISSFGDVNTGDWFYDAMASSVLMGAFQGDGVNLNPNANITRQEAFTVLARLFTLSGGDQSVLNSYTDGAQVADWAKDSMASMVAAGYVKGSDNKLNPLSSITRAEFAQVMDNLVKTYFGDSQLNVNANGNAVLNKAGTLEGATISGDLIIGDGAAEGDVVLKNVTVSGRLLVRGGGTSTVTLEGNTTVGGVTVNKPTGAVRVENNAEKAVNVNAVSDNVVLTGDFAEVNASASQGTITLNDATVATMNVAGTSAKVVVAEKSTVETMNVQGSASGAAVSVQSGTTVKTMNTAASKAVVTVNGTVNTMSVAGSDTTVKAEEGAKIEKVTTSAANTTVSGTGSVTNFEAAQGSSGASITTDGTKVTNNGTGDVTTGGDKVISSGSTGTSESDSTTPGGGGSTGGGSTGGGDEGTPILPVGGIVGVKPVDQSEEGAIAPEKMPTVEASATQDIISKVVTIKLSTDKEVPLHQNEKKAEGYWVGVAIKAPDGYEEDTVAYHFGTEASDTADNGNDTLVVDDPNVGEGKYFVAWVNAGSTAPKTHITLQWGTDEVVKYVIDLSGVKTSAVTLPETAKTQHFDELGISSTAEGLSKGETAELPEDKELTQAEVAKMGGTAEKPVGGQYVTYFKIPTAEVASFDKVIYSVNVGEELVWDITNDNQKAGWWVQEGGYSYFKLGNTFAEKINGVWSMKDNGVFNHSVKLVKTSGDPDYTTDTVVATLNFTVDMTQMGYSIEEVSKVTADVKTVEPGDYAPEGIAPDTDNELDLSAAKIMTQEDVENFEHAGDAEGQDTRRAMVNYIKVDGIDGEVNSIQYSVDRGDGKTASAEATTTELTEEQRYVKKDGSTYLKLGISFAEKANGVWNKLGNGDYTVNLTFKDASGVALAQASYTLPVSNLTIAAPVTEGGTLPTEADWKFISTYTLTGEVTLEKGYEVPADKTLVIAKGGNLNAYDVALSGEGSVVVQGGTLKINANYNGGEGSELPTIATIQVNHGGTLASMTTKVEEEAADTKFVGPGADARIQTTEGASVTFKLGSFSKGSKPTMTIAGDVTIPEGQTWYSMFDSGKDPNGPAADAGDAIGIDMTLKSGKMTVNGTLVLSSASRTGSSLAISEGASVVVNGRMTVAARGSVTGTSGSVTGGENAVVEITKGVGDAVITAIAGVDHNTTAIYTWSGDAWTTGAGA